VHFSGPRDPVALGISTVYQDLALCDNLDVVANLYLGREEIAGPLPGISEELMEKRAREVLADLNVTTLKSPRLVVASLSGGQRQSVAVARSVMTSAKLVMLDEPTAALGVAQTKQVLELIVRLKEQGHAVIVISHNLADVFEVADRIVVLRLGTNAGDFAVGDTSREEVVASITGAEFGKIRSGAAEA
jgi:D-xylose transport system ATP-binding protein